MWIFSLIIYLNKMIAKLFWCKTQDHKASYNWWMKWVRWERKVMVSCLFLFKYFSSIAAYNIQLKQWCIRFVSCSNDNVSYPFLVKWLADCYVLHQNDSHNCLWNITNDLQQMGNCWDPCSAHETARFSCTDGMNGEKSGTRQQILLSRFINGRSLAF